MNEKQMGWCAKKVYVLEQVGYGHFQPRFLMPTMFAVATCVGRVARIVLLDDIYFTEERHSETGSVSHRLPAHVHLRP